MELPYTQPIITQILSHVPVSIIFPTLHQAFIFSFTLLGRDCLFVSPYTTLQNKTEPWPQPGTVTTTEIEVMTLTLVHRSLTNMPIQAQTGQLSWDRKRLTWHSLYAEAGESKLSHSRCRSGLYAW